MHTRSLALLMSPLVLSLIVIACSREQTTSERQIINGVEVLLVTRQSLPGFSG